MATYQIWNRMSGLLLGCFEGGTERQAIEAMTIDAGYASIEHAAQVLGVTPEAYVAEFDVVEG